MTRRMLAAAVLVAGLVGFTLLAAGPFSASWSSEALFEPGATLSFKSLDSILTLNYAFGSFLSTSESDWRLLGFIWQGFGLTGKLGAFAIQADVLFGPSTGDFLYAQEIVATRLGGLDIGWYWACLDDVVLGGPADGFAVRLAGSVGYLDIVSITETITNDSGVAWADFNWELVDPVAGLRFAGIDYDGNLTIDLQDTLLQLVGRIESGTSFTLTYEVAVPSAMTFTVAQYDAVAVPTPSVQVGLLSLLGTVLILRRRKRV